MGDYTAQANECSGAKRNLHVNLRVCSHEYVPPSSKGTGVEEVCVLGAGGAGAPLPEESDPLDTS